MKRKLTLLVAVLCLLFASLLIYKMVVISKQNNEIDALKHSLPKFQFYSQNNTIYDYTHVAPNKIICIFYHNAECEHCQYQAKQLYQNIDLFNDVEILMISTNPPDRTKLFAKEYSLDTNKNITWVYDKDFNFYKWFGRAITPSAFIYDKDHNLIKEYVGEVKMSAILKIIRHDK